MTDSITSISTPEPLTRVEAERLTEGIRIALDRTSRGIAKRPPLRTFDDACAAESAGAFVYNVLDEYGQCIYIGATRDVPRRMREHSSRARWWPLAASVDVFPMIDWHQALHVERGMLKQINPPFNQQCVDRTESNVNAAKTGLFRWIMGVAQ